MQRHEKQNLILSNNNTVTSSGKSDTEGSEIKPHEIQVLYNLDRLSVQRIEITS